MRLLAVALLLLPIGARAQAKPADNVIIYRCTDRGGHLTLRDTPCSKDQAQQTLTMVRPKDAPARSVVSPLRPVVAPGPSAPAALPPVGHEPRPLYECVPPDGDAYTSDTPEGHPRWVPLWTLDIPYSGLSVGSDHVIHHDGGRLRAGYGLGGYAAGTWIRDTCYALPQAEVCARLTDRRDAIRRRFFNAMPSERKTLDVEERSINARLDADCGDH